MPAMLTHNYFGEDILGRVGTAASFPSLRDSFLLGNQGPDPFFFALRTTHLVWSKNFGSLMHDEKAAETLEALRRLALSSPDPAGGLLVAYLLGFVCHFTLDSHLHPFIYAQQYALCDAGVKGLDRRDGSIVHGQIEADLDAMMLRRRRGSDVSAYDYRLDVLAADDEVLALLDAAYQALAHEVYAVDLPPGLFMRSVYDMRLTMRLLYSSRGIKRSLLGRAERLFRRHSLLQAMTPRPGVGEVCDYDNRAHDVWENPFTRECSTASFDEMYNTALDDALLSINALADGLPAIEVTRGLNFEGARQ